jgi:hypothetical protein
MSGQQSNPQLKVTNLKVNKEIRNLFKYYTTE